MNLDIYEALQALSIGSFSSLATIARGESYSRERRAIISAANKGRVHTTEAKKKIGDAHRGKVVSEETRNKLRIINKGKIIPKEVGLKIAASNRGKKRTAEARLKQSENNGMNKIIITPNGEFRSVKAAGDAYGKCSDTIRNWIRNGKAGFLYAA